MSDEHLEQDNIEELPEEAEQAEPEGEEAPESKPEPESEPSKGPEPLSPEQQEAVNRAISRKVAKQKEAERRAEEAERQAQEAREQLRQFQPQDTGIPPMPDPYDADFDAKVRARDEAIARAAQAERDQAFNMQMQQEEARRAAEKEQEALRAKAETYTSRADALGVDGKDLQRAANTIEAQGITQDLAMYIMDDERGPELTLYLGENPAELEKLNQLSAMQAAAYIESTVKPKARREAPEPPVDPVDTASGVALPEDRFGGRLSGATFE